MKLARSPSSGSPISLVSMIDVLMILVIFFMVTSTYLQLRMLPLAAGSASSGAGTPADVAPAALLLVHLSSDGAMRVSGRRIGADGLVAEIARRRAAEPGLSVVVLPSGRARTQGLATVMDVAAQAGVTRLQILDPAAEP